MIEFELGMHKMHTLVSTSNQHVNYARIHNSYYVCTSRVNDSKYNNIGGLSINPNIWNNCINNTIIMKSSRRLGRTTNLKNIIYHRTHVIVVLVNSVK